MPQRSNWDTEVVDLIKSGEFEIDAKNGFIYGKNKEISGRSQIGFQNPNGECLFSFRQHNKYRQYPVCRAIWIASKGDIPVGMVVSHINKELNDNRLSNLILVRYRGRPFNPRTWSKDEENWLKKNYLILSLSELANECGRSVKALRHKIKKIQLPPKKGKNRRWTDRENQLIQELYEQKKSIAEIARVLDRSEDSVRLQSSRKLGLFRSDRHLKTDFRSKDFYNCLKSKVTRGTANAECCLCEYNKHIDFHHIDGNHANNKIDNIASLCPNHHREVTAGEHPKNSLYCTWWRVYSDGSFSEIKNNKSEIGERLANHVVHVC